MEGIQEQISKKGEISSVNEIDIITGATLSSNGIKQAIATALGESFDLTAANGSLVQGKNGEIGIEDSVKKASNFLQFAKDGNGNAITPTQEEINKKSDAWKELYNLYLEAQKMIELKTSNPDSVTASDEGILIAKIDEALVKVKAETGNSGGHNGNAGPADTTALKSLIEFAKTLNEADYTTDSWKAVQDELTEAEQLLSMNRLPQSSVDSMQTDLQAAIDGLVKLQVQADQNITITKTSYTKTYGDKSFSLGAKANTSLSYKTDNANVATVDASGKVTIKGVGTAKITITAISNNLYKSATKTVTIKVNKANQLITTSKDTYTKTYGDKTFSLNAKSKSTLSYKSSNTKVATVNKTGKITIKGTGTAKITITASTTANYNKATKTVTVKVNKATPIIKVNTKTKTLKKSALKSKSQTFSIGGTVNSKGTLSYKKVSGSSKLTINKTTGKITAKKGTTSGTYKIKVKISAKAKGNYSSNSTSFTITVKVK